MPSTQTLSNTVARTYVWTRPNALQVGNDMYYAGTKDSSDGDWCGV